MTIEFWIMTGVAAYFLLLLYFFDRKARHFRDVIEAQDELIEAQKATIAEQDARYEEFHEQLKKAIGRLQDKMRSDS